MVTSTINGVNLWYLQGLIIKLLLLCIDSKVLHLNTRGAAGRHGSFNASGFCHFVAVWSLIHMVRRDVWSWVVGVVPADVECWSDMDCSKSVLFRWWQQSMNVVAVVVVVAASQFYNHISHINSEYWEVKTFNDDTNRFQCSVFMLKICKIFPVHVSREIFSSETRGCDTWDLHEDDSAPVSPAHSPSLFPGSETSWKSDKISISLAQLEDHVSQSWHWRKQIRKHKEQTTTKLLWRQVQEFPYNASSSLAFKAV